MSFLMRQVAHCDVCEHEWLTSKVPSHCAKCKSRRWNQNVAPANTEQGGLRSTPVGQPIEVKIPERWKKLAATHVAHADTCKCLMCKPK